jgi:hypothetical protein
MSLPPELDVEVDHTQEVRTIFYFGYFLLTDPAEKKEYSCEKKESCICFSLCPFSKWCWRLLNIDCDTSP